MNFIMLRKATLFCFVIAAIEGLFAMPAFGSWLESAKPCEQSAQQLIGNGYKYRHLLALVSDDEKSLALFIRFYQTKKLRGRLNVATNITTKLIRYRAEGRGEYALVSEQGTCDNIVDTEHLRGLMDSTGNVYLFTQGHGRNAFSVWPANNHASIELRTVTGANLRSSRFSLNSKTGLTYAIEEKHLVRSKSPVDYSFNEWVRFDDLMEAGHKWNPLFIRATKDRVWVGLNIWVPNHSFASDRREYWEFDLDGNLQSKRKIEKKNLMEPHPGPPLFGIYVKDERKKSLYAADFLHFTTWYYTMLNTGETKTIVRLDTNQTSHVISAQGGLFIVYDDGREKSHPAFALVRYDPATGLSESTLPLFK
jgi:hypothetical protein